MEFCVQSLDKTNFLSQCRSPDPDIVRYLTEIDEGCIKFKQSFQNFSLQNIEGALRSHFPDGPGKNAWIKDIIALTQLMRRENTKLISVETDVVRHDMCRLFHVDYISARLLCTYEGAGTQWLEDDNVDRTGLGKGCNDNIVVDWDRVQNTVPFEVCILRGERYSINTGPGVVHRSPPISPSGKRRVLLRIDIV